MVEKLGLIFTEILGWVGEFGTALTTTDGVLSGFQEMFLMGVGVSLVMVALNIARKLFWAS